MIDDFDMQWIYIAIETRSTCVKCQSCTQSGSCQRMIRLSFGPSALGNFASGGWRRAADIGDQRSLTSFENLQLSRYKINITAACSSA